jgi:hypothetical protein
VRRFTAAFSTSVISIALRCVGNSGSLQASFWSSSLLTLGPGFQSGIGELQHSISEFIQNRRTATTLTANSAPELCDCRGGRISFKHHNCCLLMLSNHQNKTRLKSCLDANYRCLYREGTRKDAADGIRKRHHILSRPLQIRFGGCELHRVL